MGDTLDPQSSSTPEERELQTKRAALAAIEGDIADRELDLATLRGELSAFEARYLRVVGVLCAELDDLEAQVAEAELRLRPTDAPLVEAAVRAREKATDSANAMGGALAIGESRFRPSDDLKRLFREIARQLHPDLSPAAAHRARRTQLMADANAAYAAGNLAGLEAILSDWRNSPEAFEGEGIAAELVRTIRRIHKGEDRLRTIAMELAELSGSGLFRLSRDVLEAESVGRDLLAEMALRLTSRVAALRDRLDQTASDRTGR